MVETVRDGVVTVMFDGQRCIHSRGCVPGRPEVFVPNVQGDWIFPDAAPSGRSDPHQAKLPIWGYSRDAR